MSTTFWRWYASLAILYKTAFSDTFVYLADYIVLDDKYFFIFILFYFLLEFRVEYASSN